MVLFCVIAVGVTIHVDVSLIAKSIAMLIAVPMIMIISVLITVCVKERDGKEK